MDDLIKAIEEHKANKGKITNVTNYANTNEPRKMIDSMKEDEIKRSTKKRDIKNKPSSVRWKAGVAAALLLFSIIAAKICNIEKENTKPTTSFSDFNREDDQNPDIMIEDKIDTINEVEEDFVKKYLEVYNAKYKTNYRSADFITKNLRGTPIYQLADGRKVTRGNLPYETEKLLGQIGEYKSIEMNSDVVQIVTSDGKILGTYNVSTGEFIYSGNQLEDFQNEDFEEPTLESLGINPDKLETAAKAKLAKGVEGNTSASKRIANYNKEGFEIGD